MARPASGGLRDSFGDNSGSSPEVLCPPAPRLLFGGLLSSPCLVTVRRQMKYLLHFTAVPFAFFGCATTPSALSNSVPLVAMGAAVVEKIRFLQTEVSQDSFANISGLGACIQSDSCSTYSPLFPLLFLAASCRLRGRLSFDGLPFSPPPSRSPTTLQHHISLVSKPNLLLFEDMVLLDE